MVKEHNEKHSKLQTEKDSAVQKIEQTKKQLK
jgi:hypothetical protein